MKPYANVDKGTSGRLLKLLSEMPYSDPRAIDESPGAEEFSKIGREALKGWGTTPFSPIVVPPKPEAFDYKAHGKSDPQGSQPSSEATPKFR